MKLQNSLLLSALLLGACSSDDDDENHETTGGVAISGTALEGEVLTATNDLADEDGEILISAYQWMQDGSAISGATTESLTLTQEHVGSVITVTVSFSDGTSATQQLTSSATSAVVNVNDEPSGSLSVTGDSNDNGEFTNGAVLSVSNDLADNDGLGSITYDWMLDGTLVATGDSYTVAVGDSVGQLVVMAKYTDGQGNEHSVSSSQYAIAADAGYPDAFHCPENDVQMYFCDDFEDGTFADKWDDLISTYGLDAPGMFDVLDDGSTHSMRFTAGTRGSKKVDGELIVTKASEFTNVPADFSLEYKIRPRDNSNTGNKYLYAMLRYQNPAEWYLGGLNVQGSTTSTQVEAGYAAPTSDGSGDIKRMSQVKYPIELGSKGTDDNGEYFTDGTWYTVRVDVVDNVLTTYINGEVQGSWTDDSDLYPAAGLVGFYTYNRSFEIDYVKVFDPAVKPVQLNLDYAETSWTSAAGNDAFDINVTAITNDGSSADTFTAVSSDESIVSVAISGTTVSLTPLKEGSATITFTSGSDASVQRVLTANIDPEWIMPTTDYGDISSVASPAGGATDVYIDGIFTLEFDSTPTGLGTTAEVRIFNDAGEIVDRIKAQGETNEIGLSADGKTRVINQEMLKLDGNTLTITPHDGVLDYNQTYTVTIGDGVVLGASLNGTAFTGLGESAGWDITTKAAAPDASATSVSVDDDGDADFRTIQGALTWSMTSKSATDAVTINVKNGTYNEKLFLRNKDNLTILGESRDGVNIASANYEALNGGSGKSDVAGTKPAGGRSLFLVEGGDLLTIENLTITNTHTRVGSGDQAETIYFNSKSGRLIAKDANFVSEQDTLLMKGYNWFYNTKIAGNVDFIWGYSVATVFENSEIVTLGDSKVVANGDTTSSGGYLLQARTENASDPGFVFLNSELTHAAGPKGVTVEANSTYLARSGGDSSKFDNVTFVNTKMGDHIADIGWAYKDINGQPAPNPVTASAAAGWKEYNSMDKDGNVLDLSARCGTSGSCYELTDAEYDDGFCSRAQVFSGFNNGEGWDPLPNDTSDDHCSAAQGDTWKDGAMQLGASTTSSAGAISAQTATEVTFTANGGKFEGTNKTSFYLVSQELTGDFEISANLNSIAGGILRENGSYQFPAGLVMCVCDPTSGFAGPLAHASINDIDGDAKTLADATVNYVATYGHYAEASDSASWGKTGSTAVTLGDNFYLKLVRERDKYSSYFSDDGGVNYTKIGGSTLTAVPDTLKVGMFAAPNGSSNEPTFTFKDIQISQP